MVKIEVISIGQDKESWVSEGVAHYCKLLGKFAQVSVESIKTPGWPKSLSVAEIKTKESILIAQKTSRALTIALADRGQAVDSKQLAKLLEQWVGHSGGSLRFLIGGAYGLADSLIQNSDHVLSLSPLTFSHQLVRLVLTEQLYRAFAILNGDPYHK